MALTFPANPTNGQIYGNYYYDASIGAWNSFSSIGNVIPSTLKNLTVTTDDIGVAPFTVKNSGGTTVASIDNSGTLSANSLTLTNDLTVENGGTGAGTFTSGAYLKGNGTSAIQAQTGVPFGDVTVQAIPAAANLNTYVTQGLYHQGANVDAAGGTNYPVPYAGLLEVFQIGADGSGFTYQRYTVYQQYFAVYTRAKYSTTWSAWEQIPTGTVTVAEGGTGATTVAAAQDNLGIGLIPITSGTATNVGGSVTQTAMGVFTITGVTSVSFNNVFSTAFQKYRIIMHNVRFDSGTAADITLQLRTGTTNNATGYHLAGPAQSGGTISADNGVNIAYFYAGITGTNSAYASSTIELYSPAHATQTNYSATMSGWTGVMRMKSLTGFLTNSTAYDGFTLAATNSQLLTGTLQIFAYNE